MTSRLGRGMAIVLALTLLGGCVSAMGQKYFNDMLANYQETNRLTLAQISSTPKPLEARALVILPSPDAVRLQFEMFMKAQGYSGPGSGHDVVMDFKVKQIEMFYHTQVEALRKRQVFKEMAQERSNNPEKIAASGFDFIIYLNYRGDAEIWFLKKMPDGVSEPLAPGPKANEDYSQPPHVRADKLTAWCDNIQRTAANMMQNSGKTK